MQKPELDRLIDQKLSDEFDDIIFNDFCSKPGIAVKNLTISNGYFFGIHAFVMRSVYVALGQKISFSKIVTEADRNEAAEIQIESAVSQTKNVFSATNLCAIFLPENKFEITKDWKKTLHANLQVLSTDLENLCEREVSVFISEKDAKDPTPNFWQQIEMTPRHKFYAQAYPILKLIVAKAVPEMAIGARWGSDSPYQRFLTSDHWALFSFRISKRQQVDLAQYTEMKKIKYRCALLDLGFLGNGYGKVAKIKELISIEIPSDSNMEKIAATQAEFFARVLKQLSDLIPN